MIAALVILVLTIFGIVLLRLIYGNKALMVLSAVVAIVCIMAIPISIHLGNGPNAILFGLLAILNSHSFFGIKRELENK